MIGKEFSNDFFLVRKLRQLKIDEHTLMVLIALIIGVMGGFGAIFFRFAIRFFQGSFFGTWNYSLKYVLDLPWYVKLVSPILGGLIVGPIVYKFAKEAKGHGVPEVMESILLRGGRIRPRVMVAKIAASAVSIGSGGSVGREGPIVQIGSAIGSVFGQILNITGSRLRTLVACGTAAGIAATFNAPIAGALFAVEIILSDFGISQFSPVVVSSVSATVISRHFIGDFSAFAIPQYQLISVFEMIPYIILGVLSAFVALGFINILYKTEDLFEKIKIPNFLKPALGGLIIGIIAIKFPHIFGVGYDTISLSLNGKLAWYFLLFLVFLKLFVTSVTIGSGGSGGIFAPSLFLGATLGGFLGTIVHNLFPLITSTPGAYALVGMGAVAAGAMHAPITSILIIFELTNDYRIILPLMITCIISVLITSKLKRDSIYTLKLSRKGINIFHGKEINILHSLKVSKVMKSDYDVVYADTTLPELLDLTVRSSHTNFFVVNKQDEILGLISIFDLRKILYKSELLDPIIIAYDLLIPLQKYFTPDDSLDIVMKAFSEAGIDEFPIVDKVDRKKLVGCISKDDIIEIYNSEMLRRDMVNSFSSYIDMLPEFKQISLKSGKILSEIPVPEEFINKTLKEINIRDRFGIQVILIKPKKDENFEEKELIFPTPDYKFVKDDSILIIGSHLNVKQFIK